jgi:hypothetical protein
MFFQLEDGAGSSKKLKVNNSNRALTDSVTKGTDQDAAKEGRLFQFGSMPVNLTSANESAILYFKNNEDADLEIVSFSFGSNGMTGSNPGDVYLLRLYTNSQGITGGTDTEAVNNNLGSSKKLNADIQFGAEGSTVTGGLPAGNALIEPSTFKRFPLYWVVPKGSSLAITVQPAAGNTNATVDLFFDALVSNGD